LSSDPDKAGVTSTMSTTDEPLANTQTYAASIDKGYLQLPSARCAR
jgi:hypothetical protein